MLLNKFIDVKKISQLLITMLLFSSCVFTNKENLKVKEPNKSEVEEQYIAQFLVKMTELNIKITQFIEISKTKELSNECALFFNDLENSTNSFQKQVSKISEKKLVNLPIYDQPKNYEVSENIIIEQIINQLIAQVVEMDKIKGEINDELILNLKGKYLPEINLKLEKLSTIKVKKYTNN